MNCGNDKDLYRCDGCGLLLNLDEVVLSRFCTFCIKKCFHWGYLINQMNYDNVDQLASIDNIHELVKGGE